MSVRAPEKAPLWAEAVPSWIVAVRPGQIRAEAEIVEAPHGGPETVSADMCTVAFDGVLYNAAELRTLFPPLNGERGDAASILLRAYLQDGEKFVERLRGTFSLVIWDGRTGTVLGVRDRMGNYPLFFAEAGREVLFSNSIETLVGDSRVSRGLNLPLVALHVTPRWVEGKDETFFKSVRRVPAGHLLRLGDAERMSRYWSPAPEGAPVEWISEDEAPELFEVTLQQAVRRCLDQGSAALCLSGGLDSISIAVAAADLVDQGVYGAPLALSVEFPDPDNTEEALVQQAVAMHLGMPQTMMRLDEALHGRSLLDSALELSATWPAPLLGIFSPAYFTLIEEAKAQGRSIVMTGSGGDNYLSVCLEYAGDLMVRLNVLGLIRLWRTYSRSYRVPRSLLARRIVWKYGMRNVLASVEHHILNQVAPELLTTQARWRASKNTPAWIAPDPAIRREIDQRTIAARSIPKPKPGGFYVNEMRRSIDHPLLAHELEEAFEKGRRLGVKVAMPYYDADVVDLLCRTPPKALTAGDRSKSVVRRPVARRLAGLGVERQKKITTGNFWPQKVREATKAWREMGGARVLGELGIVDAHRLDEHVHTMLAEGRQSFVPYVWEILDHEAWVRARL